MTYGEILRHSVKMRDYCNVICSFYLGVKTNKIKCVVKAISC